MTQGHLSKLEGKLREVQVAYPIGPRGWKQRAVFSLGVMASASLVFMAASPDASAPTEPTVSIQAQAQADVATEQAKLLDATPLLDPAQATPVKDPQAPPKTGEALTPERAESQAPFVEIGAMTSRPQEDKDAFLVRVAQTMDLFTRTTHHEICGVIMVSDTADAYRVRLTTNRAHIACTMVVFDEPGFKRLGPDIHSHPRDNGGMPANARDVAYRKDFSCGQKMFISDHRFSRVDFNHGAGYLVTRGKLLYQHGAEWPIRQIAAFERIVEPTPLEVGGNNPQMSEQLAASAWKNEDRDGVPATTCPPSEEEVPAPVPESSKTPSRGPRM